MSDSPWIIEVTEATFQKEVVDRSHELPVVVDFWAPWCGPCRALGPLLEKAARDGNGKFLLAKVDIDREPNLAGAFGIQSIPTVFALRGGKAVDSFLGVMPEKELKAWLEKIQPSATEVLERDAKSLEADDPAAAEAKYRAALELSPDDAPAQLGLARALLAQDRVAESQQIVDRLAERGFMEPEAESLAADVALRRLATEQPSVETARQAAAASPGDLKRQLDLAQALAGAGEYDEALKIGLNLVRRDRQGAGETARQMMVQIFHRLGEEHDLTSDYQRKLSAALS